MNLNVISTGSNGNSYHLCHGTDSLLLDAGVPMSEIYKTVGFDLKKLNGVLCTHAHFDHIMSAKQLLSQYVDIVMSNETATELKLDMFYPNLHTDADKQIVLGNWIIKSFKLEHDTDNVGYIIYHKETKQRICYITDSGFCRYIPTDINILIIECNYINAMLHVPEMEERYMRVKETHMSLERLMSYLGKIDRSKLQHIILVHLSDRNADEAFMVKSISDLTGVQVTAASNGKNINLDEIPF